MERRQTASDRDPPRRGGNQRLPVGPGTGGLLGHLAARAGQDAHYGPADQRRDPRGARGGEKRPEDFLAFAREKVKGYKRRGQIGTFRSYRTTCRKFTAFIEETYGRKEVPFGALEAELFREFRT
ncbi:phage integrase SAM-like domain-containing protein [Salinibacter ruber]|uniref:phage integrase SAM-like domain-containing protein n=1 Tax=Salinibacter ruber TaxID=146919 RepID=UPI00311AB795